MVNDICVKALIKRLLLAAAAFGTLTTCAVAAPDCQGKLSPTVVRSAGLQVIEDIKTTIPNILERYRNNPDLFQSSSYSGINVLPRV